MRPAGLTLLLGAWFFQVMTFHEGRPGAVLLYGPYAEHAACVVAAHAEAARQQAAFLGGECFLDGALDALTPPPSRPSQIIDPIGEWLSR